MCTLAASRMLIFPTIIYGRFDKSNENVFVVAIGEFKATMG